MTCNSLRMNRPAASALICMVLSLLASLSLPQGSLARQGQMTVEWVNLDSPATYYNCPHEWKMMGQLKARATDQGDKNSE